MTHQVLGGSGYMRDYASERLARDARITTIYEGTTQLQIVAAVRGVCGGTVEKYLEELAAMSAESVGDLLAILAGRNPDAQRVHRLCQRAGSIIWIWSGVRWWI